MESKFDHVEFLGPTKDNDWPLADRYREGLRAQQNAEKAKQRAANPHFDSMPVLARSTRKEEALAGEQGDLARIAYLQWRLEYLAAFVDRRGEEGWFLVSQQCETTRDGRQGDGIVVYAVPLEKHTLYFTRHSPSAPSRPIGFRVRES